VRTRSAAAELAGSGHVRLNGERVSAASRIVKAGDVLTLALDRRVRVVKVLAFAERRGSAADAAPLYQEVGGPPAAEAPAPLPFRDPGAGRPTKRDRRALDRLYAEDEE
jgi:ribosome-associated heat shock protein Hsp15